MKFTILLSTIFSILISLQEDVNWLSRFSENELALLLIGLIASLIFTIIGAVIGGLISRYYSQQGLIIKEPRIYYQTFQEIESTQIKDKNIKLIFNQQEVKRICTTYLWLWNHGKQTIKKADIGASKLSILLTDENHPLTLLDYKLLYQTKTDCKYSEVSRTDTSINFEFDFLDKDDGIILEIQHTGSLKTQFKVEGTIQGVSNGVETITNKTSIVEQFFTQNSTLPRVFKSTSYLDSVLIFMIPVLLVVLAATAYFTLLRPIIQANSMSELEITLATLGDVISSEIKGIPDSTVDNIVQKMRMHLSMTHPTVTQNRTTIIMWGIFTILYTIFGTILVRRSQYPFPKGMEIVVTT